jgi:hypothetical protein
MAFSTCISVRTVDTVSRKPGNFGEKRVGAVGCDGNAGVM